MTRWTRAAAVMMGIVALMLLVLAWVDTSVAFVVLGLALAGACAVLVRSCRPLTTASITQFLIARSVVNLVLVAVLAVLAVLL